MATKAEIFLYLEDLRQSGGIQLFMAHKRLMNAFDLPPQRAWELVREWEKTLPMVGQRGPL